MDEREQLIAAREQLKSSFKAVYRDLRLYGTAVVNRNKAVIRNIGNNVVNAAQRLSNEVYIHKCNMDIKRAERERIKAIERAEILEREHNRRRNLEHKKSMEGLLREQEAEKKRQVNEERKLNFNNNVKQKVSSLKSRFGKVKNSFLKTFSFKNVDYKIRDAFDRAQVFGLGVLNSGMEKANNAKDKVSDFTSEQIAKYHMWRMERQRLADEREREASIRRAEEREAEERRRHNLEHKESIEELLRKQEAERRKQVNEGRRLNFNNNVKQKASSLKSGFGKVKNSFLKAFSFKNVDYKIRDAFDRAQVFGLGVLNSGMEKANNAKDKVSDFTSEQIAKYHLWRMERQRLADEREREASIRRAEEQERKNEKRRNSEHKVAMDELLTQQDREEYEVKHSEMNAKKQELIQSLIDERNRLLNLNENTHSSGRSR